MVLDFALTLCLVLLLLYLFGLPLGLVFRLSRPWTFAPGLGLIALLALGILLARLDMLSRNALVTAGVFLWLIAAFAARITSTTQAAPAAAQPSIVGRQLKSSLAEPLTALASTLFLAVIGLLSVAGGLRALQANGSGLTSFDTSAGDMTNYIAVSESLRRNGWFGSPSFMFVESGASGVPYASFPSIENWEAMGTGGRTLLATFGAILDSPTFVVGSVVVLAMIACLIMTLAAVSASLTSSRLFPVWLFVFAAVMYGPAANRLAGWWALNQFAFMTIMALLTLLMTLSLSRVSARSWSLRSLAIGVLFVLGILAYPAVGLYATLPPLLAYYVLAAWRTHVGLLVFLVRSSVGLVPFIYLGLVFGSEAQSIVGTQVGNALQVDFDPIPFWSLLGLSAGLGSQMPAGLSLGTWVLGLVSIACLTTVWGLRAPRTTSKLILGPLTAYALLWMAVGLMRGHETSYVGYKLISLWGPLVVLFASPALAWIAVSAFERVSRDRLRAPLAMGFGAAGFFVLSGYLALNLHLLSQQLDGYLTSDEGRQVHSVAPEILEVRALLQAKGLPSVTTDFGQTSRPERDTTALRGLIENGTTPLIVHREGGTPFGHSGWVLTDTRLERRDFDRRIDVVNDVYSLRYVCRRICVVDEVGTDAFLRWDRQELLWLDISSPTSGTWRLDISATMEDGPDGFPACTLESTVLEISTESGVTSFSLPPEWASCLEADESASLSLSRISQSPNTET